MIKTKLSTAELSDLVVKNELNCLPNSVRGIQYRADKENWEYEEVPTQGGKNGVKKVYTLPRYLVDELQNKGLLHLVHSNTPQPTPSHTEPRATATSLAVPDFMQPMIAQYHDWAAQQDTAAIVPVRYHTNVFGSAGNGYTLGEPLATETMWFRASFFRVLGAPPEHCFCTRVRGDSMHPTLIDHGTVLWQMQNAYTTEGIYLFRQVDELRIKRLQRVNSHTYRIISDNSNKDIYPTETLDLRDMASHEFEIYGKYLWDCAIRS